MAAMADMVAGGNETILPDRRELGPRLRNQKWPTCAMWWKACQPGRPGACWRCAAALKWAIMFQLRTKYSEAMGATYGPRRQTASDGNGLLWHWRVHALSAPPSSRTLTNAALSSDAMAPFTVSIVPMGYRPAKRCKAARRCALYAELKAAGVDVLLDDRDERRACCWLIAS